MRVYALLTLAVWREIVSCGIQPRTDEGLLRFGALKAFIDGFLMEKPYEDDPDYAGDFTFRFVDEATMAADIAGADAAGFDPVVHTIGDKAHRLLLDWYEAAVRANPARDRRFRVIHAWYPSAREVERIGKLGLIADITPQHQANDGVVERRLGPQRARTAHAWRSLRDAGARLDLVSDWPGSFNEQALTVAEAIAAYTINPAFASYEEDLKGSITAGKLADLVVVSRDILSAPPEAIRQAEIDLTILGGKVVYRRATSSA